MKTLDQAVLDLEQLISRNIGRYNIPEVRQNGLRISHILIRPSRSSGYVIVDTESNKTISTTYSKIGAIAIALAYLKRQNFKTLSHYDRVINKNTQDAHFYSHVISKTSDEERKQIMSIRFDEAANRIHWARNLLDEFILDELDK